MNKEVHWGWVVAAIVLAGVVLIGGLYWQDKKSTAAHEKDRPEGGAGERSDGTTGRAGARGER